MLDLILDVWLAVFVVACLFGAGCVLAELLWRLDAWLEDRRWRR